MKKSKITKYIPNTNIHTSEWIKQDIINHVEKSEPFSLIRFGDGDLKFIKCFIELKKQNVDFFEEYDGKLDCVWKGYQQGVTFEKFPYVWNMYRDVSNRANYISSFDLYKERKGGKNKSLLERWKYYYNELGIVNTNYCETDVGFFLFNDMKLFKYLKKNNKRVCFVTSLNNSFDQFKKYDIDYDVFSIPRANKVRNIPGKKGYVNDIPKEKWHINFHEEIKEELKNKVKDYDIFFVGGGMLGRSYSDIIKEYGKVSVDVGKMINYWSDGYICSRFNREQSRIFKKDEFTIKISERRLKEVNG